MDTVNKGHMIANSNKNARKSVLKTLKNFEPLNNINSKDDPESDSSTSLQNNNVKHYFRPVEPNEEPFMRN